jgi:hypothetical protein
VGFGRAICVRSLRSLAKYFEIIIWEQECRLCSTDNFYFKQEKKLLIGQATFTVFLIDIF